MDTLVAVKENINYNEWKQLLKNSSGNTFFSSVDYMNLNNDKKIYFELRSKKNKLIGGIIARIRGDYRIINRITKSLWIESAFCIDKDISEHEKHKIYLLTEIIKYAVMNRFCQIAFNHWSRETMDFTTVDPRIIPQKTATFVIDLSLPLEKIFSKFSKSHKARTKKAEKVEYLFVIVDENLKYLHDYYNIYVQTQQRAIKADKNSSMTLHSKKYLESLLKLKEASLHIVLLNNKVISGAITVENSNNAIYYLGASDLEMNRKYSASNLLQWEIIKWAKNKDIRFYDFGGVPVDPRDTHPAIGVYKFKKRFGGEYKEYYAPHIIISPTKYWFMKRILNNKKLLRILKSILKY